MLLLLLVAMLAALSVAYLRWGPAGSAPDELPLATPPVSAAAENPAAVMLTFTVASIPEASASHPAAAGLLQSIGAAPGAQADAATVQAWLDQLDGLVRAGLAAIDSRPRLAVASCQAAALEVQASGAASASKLAIAVTPSVSAGEAVAIDFSVASKSAEGLLELWAKQAGLALGPAASIEREVLVLPGGGAGVAAAIHSAGRREGWLVVIVVPAVLKPAPSAPTEEP